MWKKSINDSSKPSRRAERARLTRNAWVKVRDEFNVWALSYLNRNPRLSLIIMLSFCAFSAIFGAIYFYRVELPAYRAAQASSSSLSFNQVLLQSDTSLLGMPDDRVSTWQPADQPSKLESSANDTIQLRNHVNSLPGTSQTGVFITDDEFMNTLLRVHQRGYLNLEDSLLIVQFNKQINTRYAQ